MRDWEAERDRRIQHARGNFARSLKLMDSRNPEISDDGFHLLGTKEARRILFERGRTTR